MEYSPDDRSTIAKWYSNLRYVERLVLKTCYEKTLTPNPFIYDQEVALQYLFQGILNWDLFWRPMARAWGLIYSTENEGTTIIEKWQCTVPRVNLLTQAFLLAEVSECMDYDDLVNYRNSVVIVPPPC